MSNTIGELLQSHCSILSTNFQNVKLLLGTGVSVDGLFQLDFLSWYPSEDKISLYGVPGFAFDSGVKDNPNWIPTDFENVYIKTEFHGENVSIDYQLIIPGKNPVALINWWYFKVRQGNKYNYRWRVCVYGKALKMYYLGYIQRLKDYIIRYSGECCRADLCRDFPVSIPDGIIDLSLTGTNHSTKYFGEKNSPLFFRVYDKTEDLRKEKNCFAWLYPEWYVKECWRLEAQISGRYSRSMSPLDWLEVLTVDNSVIKKVDDVKRSVYKSTIYNVINLLDWVNLSLQEKMEIMKNAKKLIEMKIKKLKDLDI